MPNPLPAPKRPSHVEDEGELNADGRSRQGGSDRDIRLLALIWLMLLLSAVAFYKLAALVASACWACG